MSRRNLWPSVFSESSSPKDEDCWLFRKFYKCTGSASESGDFKVLKSNFKLNAIHGHATWQHHSPSPLTQKIPKKKKKRGCQTARFTGGPCTCCHIRNRTLSDTSFDVLRVHVQVHYSFCVSLWMSNWRNCLCTAHNVRRGRRNVLFCSNSTLW